MRRKTDKDILRENPWLLAGSVIYILLGIFVVMLPYISRPADYAALQTKEITVDAFRHHSGTYGGSYDYILTTDGEMYNVSGDYQRSQLAQLLTEGRTVTIKWYKNRPFWTLLAEEIYVDGQKIVTYNNDEPVNKSIPVIIGICAIAMGLGIFLFLNFILKHNRVKQKKRNDKIKRKYGKGTK